MIIVNYWHDADYNPMTDGYSLAVEGIVNDHLDLGCDIQLIYDAIDNDDNFEPKPETLYEIQLIRATIDADPVPEPVFTIDRIIEKVYNKVHGCWETPLVRM